MMGLVVVDRVAGQLEPLRWADLTHLGKFELLLPSQRLELSDQVVAVKVLPLLPGFDVAFLKSFPLDQILCLALLDSFVQELLYFVHLSITSLIRHLVA